jgi:hypothetical protein
MLHVETFYASQDGGGAYTDVTEDANAWLRTYLRVSRCMLALLMNSLSSFRMMEESVLPALKQAAISSGMAKMAMALPPGSWRKAFLKNRIAPCKGHKENKHVTNIVSISDLRKQHGKSLVKQQKTRPVKKPVIIAPPKPTGGDAA